MKNTLYKLIYLFIIIIIPIAIAGGSAYWRRRMNWYKGSTCTKPKCVAPLTITTPKIGSIIYLTAMIPRIVQNGVLAPFNPLRRLAPIISVVVGIAASLQCNN